MDKALWGMSYGDDCNRTCWLLRTSPRTGSPVTALTSGQVVVGIVVPPGTDVNYRERARLAGKWEQDINKLLSFTRGEERFVAPDGALHRGDGQTNQSLQKAPSAGKAAEGPRSRTKKQASTVILGGGGGSEAGLV